MVADDTRKGRVYAMDVQKAALENTSLLLDHSVNPDEKELVELFSMCHTQMGDVVPDGVKVRLVAFNLGYLPGGDKKFITRSDTTLLAIEAAQKILMPGGLISIVAYVGHSGGREEFEKIEAFTPKLPFESWNCCKLQMLNRPLAPVLVFLFKR
nr:putative rRNA methylase YtqB isoform X1 [Ipomoea batatas]